MSEEKQIEEMADVLENAKIDALATVGSMNNGFGMWYAKALYNAGCRKQSEGEWVKEWNHMECSNCHYRAPYKKIKAGYHLQDLTAYCPNCGADMRGGA